MHLRNLFAREPGGFQRTLGPICSEASQPGTCPFLLILSNRSSRENALLCHQQNQNAEAKAMSITYNYARGPHRHVKTLGT